MSVILQPCADKSSRPCYVDTLKEQKSLEEIASYLPKNCLEKLREYYPTNEIPVWGRLPGVKNSKSWEKISIGDIVLFYRDKKFFKKGIVTYKIHNSDLAEFLWQRDKDNNTWEYIYFVNELNPIDISISDFNTTFDYNPQNAIQGFHVCNGNMSAKLIDKYHLEYSDIYNPDFSEEEYKRTLEQEEALISKIKELFEKDSLDRPIDSLMREEQQLLRSFLFRNRKEAVCGVCGRQLPVPLLTAAHIKKRSKCTIEERLDVEHIVMPMCKLYGCDDLYEKGFLFVEDGIIHSDNKGFTSPDLKKSLENLEGRTCSYYNEESKAYFEYHNNHRK